VVEDTSDNSRHFISIKCWELSPIDHLSNFFNVYLQTRDGYEQFSSKNSSDCDLTINQGEKVKIKYAKNFVQENKDKKNEWTRLKILQGIMSVHHHHQN
jgi:hypothetical protein